MVTLYVLRSNHCKRRYVGITKNLPRRLSEHENHQTRGGQQLGGVASYRHHGFQLSETRGNIGGGERDQVVETEGFDAM